MLGQAAVESVWPGGLLGVEGVPLPRARCLILAVPPAAPDLAQLRKKFEEDKQRIELMRAQRKFRPY